MSVKNFVIHLRWHYQVGILSAGYLLALVYHSQPDWFTYGAQFLNVHLLLYGGATAFNSYWDRDEGPVGGLRHPPPMKTWMRWAALCLMFAGAVWASTVGFYYVIVYLVSLMLFWGYSSPLTRWKGRPIGSVVVIAVSTGINSFLLGCLSAGNANISPLEWLAAVGAGCILVSLYPASQIFQRDEDEARGDITFAVRYGIQGVRTFFGGSFAAGVVLLGLSLTVRYLWIGIFFVAVATGVGGWIYNRLGKLKGDDREYDRVMMIKYGTSVSFIAFILLSWGAIYYFRL